MLSIHQFNGLGGTIATRETLLEIRTNAIKDGNDEIVSRIDDLLFLYPTAKKFEIELDDYVIEPVPESFLNGLDYEPFQEDGEGLGRVSPTEVYDMITTKVIQMITEANLPGYKKKWEAKQYGKGYTIPFNFVTKKRYRGINLVMLTELEPIENPFFLTFKQVNELKGKIKKGAKGYEVIYFTKIWKTEDKPKNLKFSSYDKAKVEIFRTENSIENDLGVIPMLKYYHVYNGADIEGIDFKLDSFKIGFIDNEKPSTEANRMPIPEAILKNYPAPQPKLQFGGDKAFHQGGGVGLIQMPYLVDFDTVQDYYRTLFHEYSHSTGSPQRLNRKLGNTFGSKEYAFEELIAELGAIFLSAEAGIIWHNNTNHAAYLKSWNSVLSQIKDDNKFIMKASTAAQKVADFVLQFDDKGNPLYFKDLKDSTFAKIASSNRNAAKNQTVKQKFFEFLKDDNKNNFVDDKNNISVAKNSPKFYKFTQRVREHISDSKELIITDPKNYQKIYNEYNNFILNSKKTLTPVVKVAKYKVGDSVAIDTFEAKVLSFKLNRKKEFVYKCKYVIPPASGSSIFEATESDLHLYEKPKPVVKRTPKPKVNPVIAYALLDNITGEVMATKKTISEIIDFAHKNDSGKFADLELLVYEIQSIGGKNKMTNKVVIELPKKTVSNGQRKTKEIAKKPVTKPTLKPKTVKKQAVTQIANGQRKTKAELEKSNPKPFAIKPKSASVATAIKDILSTHKHYISSEILAGILYAKTKELDLNNYDLEDVAFTYFDNENLVHSNLVKESYLFTSSFSTRSKWIDKKQYDGFDVYLTDLGVEFLNAVRNRLESLRNQKNNYSLFEGLKVPIFNTPAPEKIGVPEYEIQKANTPININSLAYRRQNKNATTHEYYEIDNPNVSDFLGKIEKKKKESVAITIAGGQGSGKTSFVFQLINEFAKRYKVGHASIEEHPESALYEDKAQRFWNEHAKATVDSPEINTIDDIHKLIVRNDVIVIDSFSKLLSMDRKITLDETFRKKYDGKLFIIIYQLTTNGSMRGGSASQFDGDVILFVEKFPDFNDNYVYADKNRYQTANIEELRYNIATAQLVAPEEPEEEIQFTEEIERI